MAKLRLGLMGYRFKVDDLWVSYQTAYGKSFRVPKADIESITLDEGHRGRNKLRLVGKGTVLAEIELPKKWAQKAQAFIYMELRHAGPE